MQYKTTLTKQFLTQEYLVNKKTMQQVAKAVGCSPFLVFYYMEKLGIKRRTSSECQKGKRRLPFSEETKKKMSKAGKGRVFTKEHRENIGKARRGKNNYFYGMHHSEKTKRKMSKSSIGEKNPMFNKHFSKEAKRKASLSHGGTGMPYENKMYPSIWYKPMFREKIRKRDNYTCQNCGMTEEEHIIVIGKVLSVHHIDYNKKNCRGDNLITTCQQCNFRANVNRDYWKQFYTNKINNLINRGN